MDAFHTAWSAFVKMLPAYELASGTRTESGQRELRGLLRKVKETLAEWKKVVETELRKPSSSKGNLVKTFERVLKDYEKYVKDCEDGVPTQSKR